MASSTVVTKGPRKSYLAGEAGPCFASKAEWRDHQLAGGTNEGALNNLVPSQIALTTVVVAVAILAGSTSGTITAFRTSEIDRITAGAEPRVRAIKVPPRTGITAISIISVPSRTVAACGSSIPRVAGCAGVHIRTLLTASRYRKTAGAATRPLGVAGRTDLAVYALIANLAETAAVAVVALLTGRRDTRAGHTAPCVLVIVWSTCLGPAGE
jgi:hypothetical protein